MFEPAERAYVERARVARLATADAGGVPHVVPICFALVGADLVTAVDEKPQSVGPESLRRSRNVRENPHASIVVDHYTEDWADLGWVQVRGRAGYQRPGDEDHDAAVAALGAKYDQYDDHDLESRPVIRVEPETVRSWGSLEPRERP